MLKSLAGGTLFGEVWGTGRPEVLVLHGWGRTHADFAAVVGPSSPLGALSALAPDLPGFGASPAPGTAWGAVDYAAALIALLDGSGHGEERDDEGGDESPDAAGRPLVVLGHSRGGCIAVALAAARPDLVGGLVLTGAPLLPRPHGRRKPAARFRMARGLRRLGVLSEARMEAVRQRYGSADYRAAQGIMRQVFVRMVNERYDDELKALDCPVEFVWGDDDAEVPVEVARAALSALSEPTVSEATLTLCPGAGHLTPLTAPDALRAAVDRALSRR
jgi:pimeloyl-ACP methyl ester carboxylesterase